MTLTTRCCTFGPILLWIGSILFSAVPVAADETSDANIDYEAGFYYTVKEGDTLWDLSQRFSDTPWQWPDLWRENKQVSNPHWIYPGERIRLFRKSERHRVPQTKVVPAMIPQADPVAPLKEDKPKVEFFFDAIDQVGFIRDPAVQPRGVIYKSQSEKQLISKNDIVYIHYTQSDNAADFAPGTRLTVYRTLQPTDDSNSITRIGTQHLLLGLVEVIKKEETFAIAKVMKSYRAIHPEDKVMPYDPKKPNIAVVDSTPDIDGQIISGEDHTQLLSNYYIAFIDKGRDDNIVPGQMYQVYRPEEAPLGPSGTMVELERSYVGSLLVLHTEQTTSTVVITHNVQKMTPGAKFQTP